MRWLTFTVVVLAACFNPESDLRSVPRTAVAAAKQQIDRGAMVIIDVRSADLYAHGHIEGALHIPVDQIAARANELPRDKAILTYCT